MQNQNMTATIRQTWGCPYEAPPSENLLPFVRPQSPGGVKGAPLTVCSGYSTSLPETIELARAWSWAERGELQSFCGGKPNDVVIDGVDIFGAAVSDFRDYECPACKAERKR